MDSVSIPELRAAQVLREIGIAKLPVDPFEIADVKDIFHQANPSLDAGVSGCLMKVGDVFGIMYSTRFASEGFRRFTVSHELGHYFLDGHCHHLFGNGQSIHQSESGFVSANPYEREADAFAAGLLMPNHLFTDVMEDVGSGLKAIELLAAICNTSLTATAIRYARFSRDPVAIVCSSGQKVAFAVMSDALRERRGLTWIKKGMGLPSSSITAAFNRDISNIQAARRSSGQSTIADWFHGDDCELNEDVIGLGSYGRTLTVLWAEWLPEPPDVDISGEEEETGSLLPSQRFFGRTRY